MSSLLRPRATGPSPRSASADSLSSVMSSSQAKSPPSRPPAAPPRDSSLIRFKVTRTNPDGSNQTRTLSLNTKAACLQLSVPTVSAPPPSSPASRPDADSPLNPPPFTADEPTSYTFHICDIADIEKCHCDRLNHRCILVMYDDIPPPLTFDLAFLDQTTRDIFCELVASMDRQISIKNGCGGINTSHWVEDAAVKKCMKCGKDFSVTLRRHHCRLCGRVFCWECSDNLANLAELGYNKPVRVCGRCFDNIRQRRLQGLTVNGTAAHAVGAGGHNYNGQHAPHNRERAQAAGGSAAGSAAVASASAAAAATLVRKSSGGSNSGTGSAASSVSSSTSQGPLRHPHINTERLSDADQERIETVVGNPSPSPTATDDDSFSPPASSANPLPLLFSNSSSSPRGVTPRDGAFREGKRDKYGFIVGGEGTRGQDDRPYHRIHLAKQRKRWNQYLALHPNLESTTELRRLVRKGIPPELRGSVWQVLSGSNERQAAHKAGYYAELVGKAEASDNGSVPEIEKDLRRTFPDNHLYESEEGLAMLRRVLLAYSVHNPTVGYCQSMNFICALCLLFMDEEQAFWLLTFIVEDLTCIDLAPASTSGQQMYYYQADLAGVHIDQAVFSDLLAEKLPRISAHFDRLSLPIGPVTVNWFLCLFVNTLPLETSLHVWDCMFSEGVKTLFRCALALMKVNEKVILAARDFEQILLRAKNFHLAAAESSEFASVMFDDVWLGTFPMSRIDQLRKQHRVKIARELKERARQLELNEEVRPRPSEMAAAKEREQEERKGREERKQLQEAEEADDDTPAAGQIEDDTAGGHNKSHSSSTILSSSLRAQLRLSEAALADPFAAFSPTTTSPTSARADTPQDGDESNVDPRYQNRFRAFGDHLGPEHSQPIDPTYYEVEGGGKDGGDADAASDNSDGSDEYVTVEKPRALSSSTSNLPPQSNSPSLSLRGKSQSMSNLPPAGPHSRAMEARKRRTQSGQASPTASSRSLFGGWKSIFTRTSAADKAKKAQRPDDDDAGDSDDDLPSPTPVSSYVKPTPPPAPEGDEDEEERKAAAQAGRGSGGGVGGPIFRRATPTDSPTGGTPTKALSASNSFSAQGAGKGPPLYPRQSAAGGGKGGSVE